MREASARGGPQAASGAARAVGVALAVALAWRLGFLFWTDFAIESDEAVFGLMAKHLLEGSARPVWYYGQEYMGSLDAWAAAGFVALLGPSAVALKLTTLVFALLAVAAGAALARRVFGPGPAAWATSLYLAAPPLVLSLWSLKLRGVVSTLALGHLVLWLAHRQQERVSRLECLILGLAAGLAAWSNLLAAPLLAAAALYLVSRRLPVRAPFASALAVAGFVAGFAPFWIYNASRNWPTLRLLLGGGAKPRATENLKRTLGDHVPMLLGLKPPWATVAPVPWWGVALVAVFACGAIALLVAHRRSLGRFSIASRQRTSGAELYLLVGAGYLACAALTRFGGDDEPRYATIAVCALAAAFGSAIEHLANRGRLGRWAAGALAASVLALHVGSIYGLDRRLPTQPLHFVWERAPAPLDLSPLLAALEARGVTALDADYWVGQRIAYESGERIVTRPSRCPRDAERFAKAGPPAWLFREAGHDPARRRSVLADLEFLGSPMREEAVSGFQLVTLGTASGSAPAGSSGGPRVSASHGPDAAAAIDGDPTTRWTTGTGQRRDQWFLVELAEERHIDELRCIFDRDDHPRRLRVEVSRDRALWETVFDGEVHDSRWRMRLGPRLARWVRLTQVGESASRWWSIRELTLPDPGSPAATARGK